ncbi:GntR family transcriptional regulator [Falsigemmobacter intermedius]|uniref:GntR family transcriptional regulator n=1 Tax=Falsigemmobacter intermedius TaxID=1553448 RepID=UPI003F129318
MTLTLALRLADQMSSDILTGLLPSGARLEEVALAERFGCSRTPVREALTELCARGLAQRRAGRGVEVIRPDSDLLLDQFEALAEMEGLLAGMAAHRGTLAEVMSLEELLSVMDRAPAEDYPDLNLRLHERICAMSGNRELARVAGEMRRRLDALRGAQLRSDGRRLRSAREHAELVTAIAARDAQAAARIMRDHLRASARASLAVLAATVESA